MITVPVGQFFELQEDAVFVLPPKACLILVQTTAGTIERSLDQNTWTPVVLDDNDQFQSTSAFIRCIDDDAIISVAPYTINELILS